MACCRCGDDAECFVETMAGTMLFCRSCSEDWWAITLQPPSDEFWSIERDTSNSAYAEQAGNQGTEFGARSAAPDSGVVPMRM